MAERFYGINRGETEKDVVEGSATTATTDVEVRIDLAGIDTTGQGRNEVIQMLEYIKNAIMKDSWPPA
jgi:hypothetical protein